MADLENAEVNRQLCAVATDEMFDSWSPETQEEILAEWNDWQEESEKSGCVVMIVVAYLRVRATSTSI
jgi:hypothetical protein